MEHLNNYCVQNCYFYIFILRNLKKVCIHTHTPTPTYPHTHTHTHTHTHIRQYNI
jgi:hypothetical protein